MKIAAITTVGVACCLLSLATVSWSGERHVESEQSGFHKYLEVIDLDRLPDDNLSKAYGCNNANQVAGYSALVDELGNPIHEQALLWEIKGHRQEALRVEVVNLGNVPGGTGHTSYSNGLNNRGQIIGRVVTTPDDFGPSFGFIWDKKTGMQYLGPGESPVPVPDDPRTLPGGTFVQPIQINDKEDPNEPPDVVGFANAGILEPFDDPEVGCPRHLVSSGCQLGFIGTAEEGIRSVGILEYVDPHGEVKQYDFTRAKATTPDKLVTGFAGLFENPTNPFNPGIITASEGFLWDETHGMRGLGFLPKGGTFSRGFYMNPRGQVTGHADEQDPEDQTKQRQVAFLYDPATATRSMQSLGALPNPDFDPAITDPSDPSSNRWTFSRGLGITNVQVGGAPEIVGQSCLKELTDRDCVTEQDSLPFLWTKRWSEEGQMYDVNDLVAENPSGMHLLSAWGITDKGTICGQGLVHGERHAFVAISISSHRRR